jgi:Tol biopolymer transport system component
MRCIGLTVALIGFLVLFFVVGITLSLAIGQNLAPAEGILAYANFPMGRLFGDVYVLDVARGVRVNIASGVPYFEPLAWSPDRTKLAFADQDGNDSEIYLLDLTQNRPDRRHAYALTDNQVQDAFPAWSPDGNQIVFQAQRNGQVDLYALDLRDGREYPITTSLTDYEFAPTWSPDGNLISFASIPPERGYGLYAVDLNTFSTQYLADLPGTSLIAWSPDSVHMVFSPTGGPGLYLVEVGNRDVIELSDFLSPGQGGGNAAWSRDGRQIAVVSDHEGGSWIYILNADGSNLHRVTSDSGVSSSPAWLP